MTTNGPEQPIINTPGETPETTHESAQSAIPHSGVHHGEGPYKELDTTLREDIDSNSIKIPSDPSALKNNRNRSIAFIAGGAVLAAGSFMGVQLATGDKPRKTAAVAEATPTTGPTPTLEATAVPITPENSNSKVFTRPNGEKLSLDFITDADIKNGNAAFIIKEVASLYMTYGDPAILEGFIDTKTAVNYIKFLGEVRTEINMDKQLASDNTHVLRFDSRTMQSSFKNELPGVAKIATSGGNKIAFTVYVHEWSKFDYNVAVKIQPPPSDEDRIMTFVEANGRWLFSGYNNA